MLLFSFQRISHQRIFGFLAFSHIKKAKKEWAVPDLVVEVDHVVLDGDVALHILQHGVILVVIIIWYHIIWLIETWQYYNKTIWKYDYLVFGDIAIWQYDDMTVWKYDNLTVWKINKLKLWKYDNLTKIFIENLTVCKYENLTIRRPIPA